MEAVREGKDLLMGVLDDWEVTLDELDEIITARPSLRGILQGFLAEYKLSKMWFSDERIKSLQRYDNHSRQEHGDFGFLYKNVPVNVQVKSLQTHSVKKTPEGYIGTYQCDASDKRTVRLPNGKSIQTTCLLVDGFDLLAVSLFPFGNKWRFAFAKNSDLPRSTYHGYTLKQRQFLLATSVRITWPLQPPFRDEPFTVLDEIVAQKRRPQ